MTAATTKKAPFADASPAELRDAILPESLDAFDAQFRAALDSAAQTLRLDELDSFLEGWRRIAWMQSDSDRYRAMIAKAEYINRHGTVPPGTKTYSEEEMAELIQAKLSAASR
jgi:hypothetical protein